MAVVSEWSEDTTSKYGAVIVDNRNRLRSTGFNGIPEGIKLEPRYHQRPDKYHYFIHAEVNAILNTSVPVVGCTMYVLKPPCAACTGVIINSGIKCVKFLKFHELNDKVVDPTNWRAGIEDAEKMLGEAGVRLVQMGVDG